MKNIFLALLASIAFSSCSTFLKQQHQAETFYRQYPNELAQQCALYYAVKDSVGATVIIQAANNRDYSGKIDSLNTALGLLQAKMQADTGKISAQQLAVYKTQVTGLQKQIGDLKASYKPCQPEIREMPVFRENTAKIDLLTAANNNLGKKNEDLTKALEASGTTSTHRLYWLIGVSAVAIISIYFNIRHLF